MPVFLTKVRDARGQASTKQIEAENLTAARTKLKEQNLIATEITEKRSADDMLAGVNRFFSDMQKVKLRDMTIFTRQFSTMVNAGVALIRTLNILSEQTDNKRFSKIIINIKDKVEQGNSLSDALKDHPKIFSKLYISMVRAGETGGVLDEVLNRLAAFLEAQAKLTAQIKGAMTYPVVVLVIAVAIFFFLLTFVLPIFKEMFDSMNAQLPAFTQMLINMSNAVRTSWYLVFGGIGGGIFAFIKFIKTPPGRIWWDNVKLKAPVFGPLTRKVAVARFTRTLGTLLRSGVPLIGSLEIVQDTAGNIHISNALGKVISAVKEGETMTKPLVQTKVFPPMVTQMISIGEETGAIDDMLTRIADFYDNEVETAVKALTSLLEPLMMVLIGGMVGSIIIGMYLPMFSIIGAIG